MIHEIKEFLISRTYPYESCNKKKVLILEPTNIPDVFNVYEVTDKIGIAHIPNMKTSVFCKENIKEKTKCLCVFSKDFNKWIPLELAK